MAIYAHDHIQGPSAESRCLDATGTAQDKSSPNEPSSVLHTSSLIVLLASCYAAAAVFAWVIICISTTRPIFAHGYQYKVTSRLNTPEIYAKSERLVKTARVVGTIVSVITIPLTSAVCAQAAVVFLQQPRRGGKSPTLRQTMALADKSWNDPLLIFKLVAGQWSKYGSRFLAAAIVLNILGITVAPLQEIFVSYKTIKAAVYPYLITDIFDLVDAFEQEGSQSMDDDFTTFLTRSKLTSTRRGDAQPQLWSDKTDHNAMGIHGLDTDLLYTAARQHSFDNMTVLKNPFWAALPAGFSSGLIRQYVPRFNFSAKAEQITSDSFPSDCSSDPQALHLYYNKSSEYVQYSLRVCMPGNMTQSPWRPQRSRQDFREELFLVVDFSGPGSYISSRMLHNASLRITLDTTAGYFEVPNYMNGQVAGPLLDDDPVSRCRADDKCPWQFSSPDYTKRHASHNIGPDWKSDNTTSRVDYNLRKGPLLSIVMALFGRSSLLDSSRLIQVSNTSQSNRCLQIPPMYNFLKEESTIDTRKECIRASTFDSVDAEATYASIFFPRVYKEPGSMKGDDSLFEDKINIPVVENAFTVAAFLAVDALASAKPSHNIDFKYDLGVDTLVPVMSPVAMAFISAQLCLFLGSLLAMALYSALKPRWTLQLDAFAMMRIGAQAAERFPLLVTRKVQKYSILDETPGWIGGAMPAHDEKHKASQLELGALVVPLRGREFYHCYPADDERELRRMKRERNASRWYQPFW